MNEFRSEGSAVLHAQSLVKCYQEGNNELEVLRGVELVVEQGDIFSGLVVDSVLGMQYFATDSFKDSPEGVPENVQPFVSGGYERNEEVWKVFSAVDLLEDERFLDVAQW